MKSINIICCASVLMWCLASCSQSWQAHYHTSDSDIQNEQLEMVQQTSEDYLKQAEGLGKMYQFLKQNRVFEVLKEKNQLHTLLLVEDADFEAPTEDSLYIANSHVTDICLSPSNLYNGERVLMWHEKFVTVGLDSVAVEGDLTHITFNGAAVKKVVKTTDGYLYVLESMIKTPISLQDYINDLPENYSRFKDMVLSSGGKKFDKEKSKPIGVDATGNTIYDTVWIYTNDFFDAKNFSLSSESLTATMLLFSNEVIEAALAQARASLNAWGMERDEEVLLRWLLEVAFYNKIYEKEQLIDNNDEAFVDLKSIYNRQWRVEAQELDLDHPIRVSNGLIYEVKQVRIPNNVLMYRVKDFYRNYEYCSDEEKEKYFQIENIKNIEMKEEVAPWTPLAGVWPPHGNTTFSAYLTDDKQPFSLSMQLNSPVKDASGNITGVKPYRIPPGKYRFAMGFFQNMNISLNVTVYALNDNLRVKIGEGQVTVGSTTEFHYDRGTFLSDTWPEGYKEAKNSIDNSKKNNYDTDGGGVIAELEVPDLKGNGEALPLIIHLESTVGVNTRVAFHHWCLRPTVDNY